MFLLRGSVAMAALSAPDITTSLYVTPLALCVSIFTWKLKLSKGYVVIQDFRMIIDTSYSLF